MEVGGLWKGWSGYDEGEEMSFIPKLQVILKQHGYYWGTDNEVVNQIICLHNEFMVQIPEIREHKQFEYMTREAPCPSYIHITSMLNELGKEGWQVVAKSQSNSSRIGPVFYFMREKK